MKATARAPANIAFIKYWGKADDALRLPLNPSLSMNVSGAYTVTTVDFSPNYTKDNVSLLNGKFSDEEAARVIRVLDQMRTKVGRNERVRVATQNTFPKGIGSAASASGFAALTVAGFAALEVAPSERELTIFARQGSGSACRSIPDGFVVWRRGYISEESYAYSLYPHTHWDIRDILVIVDSTMKKVSTTEGMNMVQTSPLLKHRLDVIPARMKRTVDALSKRNFQMLGEVIEEDCLDTHAVMRSQVPSLEYWNTETQSIIYAVRHWRGEGIPVYFTIDAGPNVHLICEGKDESKVLSALKEVGGIESIIVNKVSEGTRIIEDHLF
ncbi:MAG: diphosphomevalonate decarboxylase [bacterium]|nr:diphosphomevalonate decarboxylase [bacterium]